MTTAGGFAMLVGMFFIPQIVILRRSRLSSDSVWLPGILSISVGHFIGWLVAPWLFAEALSWHWRGPRGAELLIFAAASVVVGLIATGMVALAKRRDEAKAQAHRDRIEAAKAMILADGVVSGPGKYVASHRQRGPRTQLRGAHDGRHGPYGVPTV